MTNEQTVSVNRAAEIIGCSPQQVRTLLRINKLKGFKSEETREWEVLMKDATRYKKLNHRKGWPRGVKRK